MLYSRTKQRTGVLTRLGEVLPTTLRVQVPGIYGSRTSYFCTNVLEYSEYVHTDQAS
jgi:hypothetical protein